MNAVKYFRVVDGPLKVRSKPGGQLLKQQLKTGEVIEAQAESRQEQGGYVWWQHKAGWTAERTASNDAAVFMEAIEQAEAEAIQTAVAEGKPLTDKYIVVNGPVKIRMEPGGQALSVELDNDMVLRVDTDSRTEQGGYVWWKHSGGGWSAESNISGSVRFLKAYFGDAEVFERPEPKKVEIPATMKGKMFLQAAQSVKIRNKPSTDPRGLIINTMARGDGVEVDMDSLTEADGYYWVKQESGWMAMQDIYGEVIFLAEPGTIPGLMYIGPDGPRIADLPHLGELVTGLPVKLDAIQWFQYFGNNVFAYVNGKSYGYDRYSQGLHGGLDLGNSLHPGVPIYAGLHGTFVKADYARAQNWRIYIDAGDDYEVIYQHITNIVPFQPGQEITPDTKVAEIEHSSQGGWDHLHFEIRYMKKWIVNPLVLMTPELQKQLIGKFDPNKENSYWGKTKSTLNCFYRTAEWDKWTTPLDQPVITLNGPLVGPRAEEK